MARVPGLDVACVPAKFGPFFQENPTNRITKPFRDARKRDSRRPGADRRRRMEPSPDHVAGRAAAASVPVEVTVTVELGVLVERVAAALAARLEAPASSPWLDVNGAASYLACSRERVRKLVARKEVPFHQEGPGSRIFFNRGELDEWLLSL
jgi:excisionase family DNA binding protein